MTVYDTQTVDDGQLRYNALKSVLTRERNNDVEGQQHETLHVVGLAVPV